MKNNPTLIIALVALLTSFTSFAQQEPLNHEHNDDSLIVVLPQKSNADLALIVPPEGFEPTDKFNGYLHAQAGSGIIMTMIEHANYIKMDEGMTEDFFSSRELEFVKREKFTSDNAVSGIYYKSLFVIEGQPFTSYIVYAGNLNRTLWLNITYPTPLEELVESELLKTIQSITLNTLRDEK